MLWTNFIVHFFETCRKNAFTENLFVWQFISNQELLDGFLLNFIFDDLLKCCGKISICINIDIKYVLLTQNPACGRNCVHSGTDISFQFVSSERSSVGREREKLFVFKKLSIVLY
jgi:hypothetical protein